MSSSEQYLVGGYGYGNPQGIAPRRSLSLVTAPTSEPIAIEEAKLQCRVDGDDEDDLISTLIIAARNYAEEWMARRLENSVWDFRMDQFPGYCNSSNFGQRVLPTEMLLPYPPLVSVSSITYVDANGVTQTLASSSYIVDKPAGPNCEPGRISLAYGSTWPVARAQANAVTVRYTAGYSGSTPALILAGMKLFIAHLYENRAAVDVEIRPGVTALPLGVEACWAPFRNFACA